jgi:ubiquitin-protein ligase E3 C
LNRAGIDGGGVFKEFFTSLCKEVFDTDRGLWLANKKNELYPNPHQYATERMFTLGLCFSPVTNLNICSNLAHSLNWYRFIGRILGKALYQGILVDVAFAGFFLSKVFIGGELSELGADDLQWLGRQSFLDDLYSLDPDLYNGLIFLKHYSGNPEDLSLNFTVAIEGMFSASKFQATNHVSPIGFLLNDFLPYRVRRCKNSGADA